MGLNFIKTSKYFQSDFIRNSAVLVSGNIVGQAVALLVYPILTRFFYSAEDFGVFSLFLSITGLLTIFSTACYEEAFLIVKDEKQELSLLGLVLRILIIFSGILLVVLLFFRNTLLAFFNVETVTEYWYLIPFMVFFSGLFATLTKLANRERKYKSIASANIALNVESSAFKILLGIFSFKGLGLILSNVVSQAISCFFFYRLKDKFGKMFHHWQELSTKSAASTFKAFPMYTLPRNFISTFSANLPILMLATIFGEARLGFFSLAFTLTFRPIHLLAFSINQVLFEKITSLKLQNKSIHQVIKQFCTKIFLILLPIFILAFVIANPLFKAIYGYQWGESAIYFQYMLPWMFIMLITSSISFLPILLKKQHLALWVEILYITARILALLVGILYKDFKLAILLYSATSFLFMIGILLWYFLLIKQYETELRIS